MKIDTTRDPMDLFIDHMLQSNPSTTPFTSADIVAVNLTDMGGASTTVDIDLLIPPSDVPNDHVKFTYSRIPVEILFGELDDDIDVAGVQEHYPVDVRVHYEASLGQLHLTPELKEYILHKYAVNVGVKGVTVATHPTLANAYVMAFNNIIYKGVIDFIPTP
jgi:hypothetical protein